MTGWLVARPRPLTDDDPSGGPLARIGGRVRVHLRPRLPSIAHVGDGAIGLSLIAGVPLAVVALPLLVGPPLGLAGVAVLRARRSARRHDQALTVGLADLLDQLGLAVGAGLTLPAALREVAPWAPSVYRPILDDVVRRIDAGSALADVLHHLGRQVPAAGRRSIAVLAAAVRDGTPVGPSLLQAAEEARRARRRLVEAQVRRLPVLLLLPLVVCVLPAFVLLTLVPLVLGSLDGLTLPGS